MKKTYTADDGRTFDTFSACKAYETEQKAAAKKRETTQKLTNFFVSTGIDDDDVEAILARIEDDPAAWREAAKASFGKRKPRSDVGMPRGRRPRAQAVAAE